MKVSIITPFYNAEQFLGDSIGSVLRQSYDDWELVLVNDGSIDRSEEIARSYDDTRIRYLSQPNGGVSRARNRGLSEMSGDAFCFLDADDLMMDTSISSRIDLFEDQEVAFVGGGQEHKNEDLSKSLLTQLPSYQGNPREGLLRLDPTCFINCGTWLIRLHSDRTYQFPVGWTHSEDLAFFLSIADQGTLVSVPDIVQTYRRHSRSAMADLKQLENGYKNYFQFANEGGYIHGKDERDFLMQKIRRIMVLSYLSAGMLRSSLKMLIKRW